MASGHWIAANCGCINDTVHTHTNFISRILYKVTHHSSASFHPAFTMALIRISVIGLPDQAQAAAAFGSSSQFCKGAGFGKWFVVELIKATKHAGLHLAQIQGLPASGWIKASAGVNTKAEVLTSEMTHLQQFHFKDADATAGFQKCPYSDCKGWSKADDSDGSAENAALMARLLLVAAMASDRSQMHSILASQRDNWNKLFQGTLRLATIAAAMLSALNGGPARCLSLSLAAALLNFGSSGMMHVINQFQPSQLAEEQRTAARLFTQLEKDIETTLKIHRRLREDFNTYLNMMVDRLHTLDRAYPLPLTPGGLDKFPKVIAPAQLSPRVDEALPEISIHDPSNGWTSDLVSDLKNTSELIKTADVAIYLSWATDVLKFNKIFAMAAPLLAAAAGCVSILDGLGQFKVHVPVLATCLSILSMFTSSFSHDMQLGMIFELYRSCAGYFCDIDASIQRTIRTPVEKREDGALFHQRVALMLGRRDQMPIVPAKDKTAGSLF